MVPRPPCSALFPYTTLFRSGVAVRQHDQRPPPGVRRREDGAVAGRDLERQAADVLLRHGLARPPGQFDQDRKSTRLNSSHMSISYAVFCLKKKTTAPDAVAH